MKFVLIFFLAFGAFAAKQDNADRLIRRLYLDIQDRLPSVSEYQSAKERLTSNEAYRSLVDDLMADPRFSQNLSRRIITHYAPPLSERDPHPVMYRRLAKHIEKTYAKPKDDFRVFINDMWKADGISFKNQMLLFYNKTEGSKEMASRFTEKTLGITIGCAECHDHKFYPDLKHQMFWSLATFFEGMNKQYIESSVDLKLLDRKVGESRKSRLALGDEYEDVLYWIKQEKEGKNIYDELTSKERMGQYFDDESESEEMMEGIPLLAPQLYIYEGEKLITRLNIKYTVEGKEYRARPRLPFGSDRPIYKTETPREYLANWIAYKKPHYFARATTNWISHWLLGRGLVMPANDVYGNLGEQGLRLDAFAKKFRDSNFQVHHLVRELLNSSIYKMASAEKSDEEGFVYFKSRKFRHLTGAQVLNILFAEQELDLEEMGDLAALYDLQQEKTALTEELFPASLSDSEAYYRGSLSQALFLTSNERVMELIDLKAKNWHKYAKENGRENVIKQIFISFYTRLPTDRELVFFKVKLNEEKAYDQSGFFEMIWTIINSPEMRIY